MWKETVRNNKLFLQINQHQQELCVWFFLVPQKLWIKLRDGKSVRLLTSHTVDVGKWTSLLTSKVLPHWNVPFLIMWDFLFWKISHEIFLFSSLYVTRYIIMFSHRLAYSTHIVASFREAVFRLFPWITWSTVLILDYPRIVKTTILVSMAR